MARSANRNTETPASESIGRQIAELLPVLRRYALKLTRDGAAADDLVQDAIVRGIEKIHLWRPGTNLQAWFFTILRNLYVSDLRRLMRHGVMIEPSDSEPALVSPPPQAGVLLLHEVQRALQRLTDEQRDLIILIGLNGEPYNAVASSFGLPVGTVRSRLARGRQALRQLVNAPVH